MKFLIHLNFTVLPSISYSRSIATYAIWQFTVSSTLFTQANPHPHEYRKLSGLHETVTDCVIWHQGLINCQINDVNLLPYSCTVCTIISPHKRILESLYITSGSAIMMFHCTCMRTTWKKMKHTISWYEYTGLDWAGKHAPIHYFMVSEWVTVPKHRNITRL